MKQEKEKNQKNCGKEKANDLCSNKLFIVSQNKKYVYKDTSNTYNLFFCVFIRTEKVDSLHVTKVNVMTQKENKQ